jgi:hypothetical protein
MAMKVDPVKVGPMITKLSDELEKSRTAQPIKSCIIQMYSTIKDTVKVGNVLNEHAVHFLNVLQQFHKNLPVPFPTMLQQVTNVGTS